MLDAIQTELNQGVRKMAESSLKKVKYSRNPNKRFNRQMINLERVTSIRNWDNKKMTVKKV